ncbi:tubulin epsilon and delta complex protein 1 [Cyprinodon tularosa]|uniref:tubulin epsilon and delta complex protein 1 n=1 Tax=Cyprinodon tularosa TaxID=77115 RepID=UPI0018E215FF|nr:tubulin epsilon and delta complex protein 1 [Cyprinodon tularosa]
MQAPRAAVSVEVKRVIGALCRLLAALGVQPVPAPEAFRRAKFGGKPEEDPFWQLLCSILQTSGMVSCGSSSLLTGESRKLVAVGLWQSGYHGDWMYDGGSCSSTDLLLALGWLLAGGALEKLLSRRVECLDPALLTSAPQKPEFSGEVEAASLRRLQWLTGRLRHQGRTLLATVGARTQALHDVLFTSQLCSAAPSAGQSSAAPSAGQSSVALTEDCDRLQQLCDVLDAYVSWKQTEKVFWTWMDSVADRRFSDLQVRTPPRPARRSLATCYHGNQMLARMEEMLRRLPDTQERQMELQERRSKDEHGRSSEGGACVGGACVGIPPLCPPPSPLLSAPSIQGPCRVRLQAGKMLSRSLERAPSSPSRAGAPSGAGAPGELPCSEAAEQLLQAEAVLLQRRDRRRLANRKQLQERMDVLDQQVFIPL